MAQANVALQSALQEMTRWETDTSVLENTTLQRNTTAKRAEILQLVAKHVKLTDKVGCLKAESAAEYTVFEVLKLAVESCTSSEKRAKVARRCEDFPATPSTTAYLASHAKRDNVLSLCETLSPESQCIFNLAAEAKQLR